MFGEAEGEESIGNEGERGGEDEDEDEDEPPEEKEEEEGG